MSTNSQTFTCQIPSLVMNDGKEIYNDVSDVSDVSGPEKCCGQSSRQADWASSHLDLAAAAASFSSSRSSDQHYAQSGKASLSL